MSGRRNPFEELERMFERLSRELEDAAHQWGEGGWSPLEARKDVAIDLVDEGDAFVVTMDLPGFERDEIELRVADETLWVNCERSDAREEDAEEYLKRERRHASVRRSVGLPAPVKSDEVSAKLRHGILTVTVPKAEPEEESTRIDIEEE